MKQYISWFDEIRMKDVAQVGGKNASLGEMIHALRLKGVRIPNGFAVIADAYRFYLEYNHHIEPMRALLAKVDPHHIKTLQEIGRKVRALIASGEMPSILVKQIGDAYHALSKEYKQQDVDVAVRSSATAEDLPTASFAGQQETFLNVRGADAVVKACKKSMASLFTDRAIIYRMEHGFDHLHVALSIGIQKMVRSDKGVSGVAFSLDTETGFKNVIMIDAAYGLGESIVQGTVNPDEYVVFKPTLEKGYDPIIKKRLGSKKTKIVYSRSPHLTKTVAVPQKQQNQFALPDKEIVELSSMVNLIDQYYSSLHDAWTPMDVEWAKDGIDGRLYILQSRPETIHGRRTGTVLKTYHLKKTTSQKKVLVSGQSIGGQITAGPARVILKVKDIGKVREGDIIVTTMTDPDWVPVMKRAAGIITDLGGRTCHAAIVSRELGRPAVVGTKDATKRIKSGQQVTIDCSQGADGFVYEGAVPFEVKEVDIQKLPEPPVALMVNLANPDDAFVVSQLPVAGVGLARIEFIITNAIKIHPMALLNLNKIKSKKGKAEIEEIVAAYKNKKQFFIDTLAQGIGMIAAAFYPRPVTVRLSDFKTNEYRNLLGGELFEMKEANPMLGFRGAARYTSRQYEEAFRLELAALEKVRHAMGLDNVKVMIPFVRTVPEAKQVIKLLAQNGLRRKRDGLELVMMCELPSNVILIDEFAQLFDGFSIGSNDLTQLTLGVDRDSALLAPLFDERDPAVEKMMVMAIAGAHRNKRFIGICGQAPSDYPELADLLIKAGIDSLSLNPDAVVPFLRRLTRRSNR